MRPPVQTNDPLVDLAAMVVDDQIQTRNMISDSLRSLGIGRTYVCGDGDEAIQMLARGDMKIDVIVCDWMMPKMSGIEVLRRVRESHPGLPFLMVTAKADVESVKAAKIEGVSAYVIKPFTAAQLEVKLRVIFKKPAKAPVRAL
ncbi:MAG: response regulator [Alphaproteobacteria bacterium]|nr:response regulator [Alphaproteobacteria bacterium]